GSQTRAPKRQIKTLPKNKTERKNMSTNVATQKTLAIRVTRLIKAPRERVFAAWTKPEEITRWFGPPTCRTLSAKTELRAGGKYHFHVTSEKIGEHDLRGEYREVKAP